MASRKKNDASTAFRDLIGEFTTRLQDGRYLGSWLSEYPELKSLVDPALKRLESSVDSWVRDAFRSALGLDRSTFTRAGQEEIDSRSETRKALQAAIDAKLAPLIRGVVDDKWPVVEKIMTKIIGDNVKSEATDIIEDRMRDALRDSIYEKIDSLVEQEIEKHRETIAAEISRMLTMSHAADNPKSTKSKRR